VKKQETGKTFFCPIYNSKISPSEIRFKVPPVATHTTIFHKQTRSPNYCLASKL
jgi:hypothetical protein